MGGASRGQIAERIAAGFESTERSEDAAKLRAASDGTARSPARAGALADDRRGGASGGAPAPSSRGVGSRHQRRMQKPVGAAGMARLPARNYGRRDFSRRRSAGRRALHL